MRVASPTAHELALAATTAELTDWAKTNFRGVTDLKSRGCEGGQFLSGRYGEVWLRFFHAGPSRRIKAQIVVRCECCGLLVRDLGMGTCIPVTSPVALTCLAPSDLRECVDMCVECRDLHAAQKAAGTVGSSRLRRWRFVRRHDMSPETALSGHQPPR